MIADLICSGSFRNTLIGLTVYLPCGWQCKLSLLLPFGQTSSSSYIVNLCWGYRCDQIGTVSIQPLNHINFSGMCLKDSANFIMVCLFPDGSIPLPLCNHHGDLLFAKCKQWTAGHYGLAMGSWIGPSWPEGMLNDSSIFKSIDSVRKKE